jgi:tRNA A-37 threonylcarbamoyl transferase component Bud32
VSSTATLKDPNTLLFQQPERLAAFTVPKNLFVLYLIYQRGARTKAEISQELSLSKREVENILSFLSDAALVSQTDGRYALTLSAQKRLNYASFSLSHLEDSEIKADPRLIENALRHTYALKGVIGRGTTSVTFRAQPSGTYRDRALKLFLPGLITYDQLDLALRSRQQIDNVALPDIIEVGQVQLNLPQGAVVTPCVVFQLVKGAKTFADFLREQKNVSKEIFERFVERVGGALAAIEDAGRAHGDLHEGNILVEYGMTPTVARDFWVIDFIGVPSANSPELEVPTDIENFRDHLLRASIIASERYPGVSARFLLGERVFRVLEKLRKNEYKTFREMLQDFRKEEIPIPSDYFRKPLKDPFEWLRVEVFPSQDWLYKLFEPVPSRYETISRFGNTWISGPRGCGKSHYLRVLTFQPEVIVQSKHDLELEKRLDAIEYDYKRAFGVLFNCRLGEFRPFVPEAIGKKSFDSATQAFLKHVLILKIWNRTLHSIREGLRHSVIQCPSSFRRFIAFLSGRLGSLPIVDDLNLMGVYQQCFDMCTAREASAVAVWNDPPRRQAERLLTEADLDRFFLRLRQTFAELNSAQFYILVDDASYGHIHFEMQKILNSLVRAAHANHCFKITCDKFTYTLDTSDDRAIDPRHEVTYVDLGEVSTKVQKETIIDLSKYMGRVVNTRLRAAGYESSIQTILGKSQSVYEFLSALSSRGSKEGKLTRRRAYYAGWNIVWSVSHGSVRTLLELVEYIFRAASLQHGTKFCVPLEVQDAAVRNYSKRQFRSLSMVPGVLRDENLEAGTLKEEPLGPRLQAAISAIGHISKEYIRHYDTGEQGRWYETISVERLDRRRLPQMAQEILTHLIQWGLLLDEGVTFSRAQIGLSQRYDLNKIFAPAFQSTYRVRNHMYLSSDRFAEMLMSPDRFVARYRKKLSELASPGEAINQGSLFEDRHEEF